MGGDNDRTTRRCLLFALGMFLSVSLLQVFVAPAFTVPAEVTLAILVVSIAGWLMTRERARTH